MDEKPPPQDEPDEQPQPEPTNRVEKFLERVVKRIDQSKKHPLLIIIGTIGAVIAFISACGIAFGLSAGWWVPAPIRTQVAYWFATPTQTATATPLPTSTPTFTRTPTPTFTPSITPTPTATPLEGTPFAADQVGIVLADFTQVDASAPEIVNSLRAAFEHENIPYIFVAHPLQDRAQAQQIADMYNATLVIWGESYELNARVYFSVNPPRGQVVSTINDLLVAVTDNFSTFVTYEGMGVPYLLDFTLGQMYFYEGSYDDALLAFDRAVERIPEGRESEVQAGSLYMHRGIINALQQNMDAALADFDRALSFDPEPDIESFAHLGRGVVFFGDGRVDDAIDEMQFVIDNSPDSMYAFTAYYMRGLLEAFSGRREDAQASFEAALALDVDVGDVLVYAASAAMNSALGQTEQALADYTRLLELAPDYAGAHYQRGLIYYYQGDFEQALEDFNRELERDPDFPDAYFNRAYIYSTQGRIEESLADYTRAIELNPNHALAYNNRGYTYAGQGDFERALPDVEHANELQPDTPLILDSLGYVYAGLGDYEQALTAYNRALELDPTQITSYGGRGSVYYQLGSYPEAIADYREYERRYGQLEPEMQDQIAEMEAALTATPSP